MPIIVVGVVNIFLKDYISTGCLLLDQAAPLNIKSILTQRRVKIVLGPTVWVTPKDLRHIVNLYPIVFRNIFLPTTNLINVTNALLQLLDNIVLIDSIAEFNNYIGINHADITPRGIYLGGQDSPLVFAYTRDLAIHSVVIVPNLLNNILTNVSIITQFQLFDVLWLAKVANTPPFIVYFGLSMCACLGLFTLHPIIE
jgi:hypothetical protein